MRKSRSFWNKFKLWKEEEGGGAWGGGEEGEGGECQQYLYD